MCSRFLKCEGDSKVYWFLGGFSEYEENHKKRLGGDIEPHRIVLEVGEGVIATTEHATIVEAWS